MWAALIVMRFLSNIFLTCYINYSYGFVSKNIWRRQRLYRLANKCKGYCDIFYRRNKHCEEKRLML